MKDYRRIELEINTLSYCIVSPRESQAFYEGIDFVKDDIDELLKGINVIYPFYRYGTYDNYNPKEAEYYIPGSSIKGALLRYFDKNDNIRKQLMVDDIVMDKGYGQIKLKKIWKYQNIHTKNNNVENNKLGEKKVEYEEFFSNVAFEMLCPDETLIADVYIAKDAEKSMEDILKEVHKNTMDKLDAFIKYLNEVKEKVYESSKNTQEEEQNKLNMLLTKIEQHIKNINKVKAEKGYLMYLGGYKGLIRALKGNLNEDKINIGEKGALFIDNDNGLPYGIVKINI